MRNFIFCLVKYVTVVPQMMEKKKFARETLGLNMLDLGCFSGIWLFLGFSAGTVDGLHGGLEGAQVPLERVEGGFRCGWTGF